MLGFNISVLLLVIYHYLLILFFSTFSWMGRGHYWYGLLCGVAVHAAVCRAMINLGKEPSGVCIAFGIASLVTDF